MYFRVISLIFTYFLVTTARASPYSDPHCASGRHAIVHLFSWKWSDIKAECERFLGPYGFCGVQVSPAMEYAVITNPNRPWWERYQPVSYKLTTRSGTEADFRDMVATCNQHGVRIYVDTVINHMTGEFSGVGTAGSNYDGKARSYPGVPYTSRDFNGQEVCATPDLAIHDYNNRNELRNCGLFGLVDLKLGSDNVRREITDYLNKLTSMGVAGFRIDAAKHMWPGDLTVIFARLNDLPGATFGSGKRPFVFQEVIELTSEEVVKMAEYYNTGRVTNFMYGQDLSGVWLLGSKDASSLQTLSTKYGHSDDEVVFVCNHDNQRGHGNGDVVMTFREKDQYILGTAFMLAYPYGMPRIMSSYNWPVRMNPSTGTDQNDWIGPPHNADMSIQDVSINADLTCAGDWVCEHRWPAVYRMVAFNNVVAGSPIINWRSFTDNQIAFSRGNKGFVAFVTDGTRLNINVDTVLPSGTYCDVISGDLVNDTCTGATLHVASNGLTHVNINGADKLPAVAIHIGAKIGSPKKTLT